MKFFSVCLFALSAASISLYAGPVPIIPAQLGYSSSVTFGSSAQANEICPADVASLGCGGAFTENIGGINATVWCVDSQLNVHWGDSYPVYIEDLNGTPGPFDGSHVHYADVNSHTGTPHWIYDITSSGAPNPDSALTRYELAAILISQYVPSDSTPLNNTENQSIQDAIWHLTENTSVSTQPNLTGPINVDTPSPYTDWIAYAANILNTPGAFNLNQWAVISGGWQSGSFTGTQYQTFLVQVTPEPRFYGLLLAVLLGLGGVVYRRRISS